MRAHIKALMAALAAEGWSVHYGDATGVQSFPYVLLWSTVGDDDVEVPMADDGGWSDLIGITVVDTIPLNTVGSAQKVRDMLDGLLLTVPDRHAILHLRKGLGQSVQVDRDVTITGTNTHPCYVVERYLLTSQPI